MNKRLLHTRKHPAAWLLVVLLIIALNGQPPWTEARYHVEAAGAKTTANLADTPSSACRYLMSTVPLVVDDFGDTSPINALGGVSGTYGGETGGSIVTAYDGERLRLDYNVSALNSYAGYFTSLNHADLTPYSMLTFQIKGAAGGEKVKVALRDDDMKMTLIAISEFLEGGITTSWQQVVVPLANFTGVKRWSSMDNLMFEVQNRIGSGTGTIYLDQIRIEARPVQAVPVSNFNGAPKENATGGGWYTYASPSTIITGGEDPDNRWGYYGAGYRFTYSGITPTAYVTLGTTLGVLDISRCRSLSFLIKGKVGGEKPNIYLMDNTGHRKYVDIEKYTPVAMDWRPVMIPLVDFAKQGIDLTQVKNIEVVFEWENTQGTIYLENFAFTNYSTCLPAVPR